MLVYALSDFIDSVGSGRNSNEFNIKNPRDKYILYNETRRNDGGFKRFLHVTRLDFYRNAEKAPNQSC